MKRRVLIALAIILSLLFVSIPVNASTITMDSAKIREPAQIHQTLNNNLADIINTLPEGHHDNFAGVQNQFFCRAEGWAADPDDRSIDLNVRILSDGVEVGQTVADTFRQDLADAGVCTDGTCSFSVNLWGLITPDVDHVILVQAQDAQTAEWVTLYDTPKTLNCFEENFPVEGYHDGWEGIQNSFFCLAEGWVIDHNDPNLDLNVRILSDGVEVAQTTAGDYRQDLDEGGVCPGGTCSLFTFKGQLYAGTGNWTNTSSAGQIWRSANGTDWSLVAVDGLGNPNNTGFTTFTSFNGLLYAAAINRNDGLEIWRTSTGNNGSWERVATEGFGGGAPYFIVTSLTVFKGQLYAGIEATPGTGAQVWRSSNGANWTLVADNGFGDTANFQTGSSVVYNSQLYMTTRNDVTGAQLWKTNDGTTWVRVVGDGFGDINNIKIESLTTYAGALYAAANNPVTGVELWRSTDGVTWTQINVDGFGDSNIFVSLWSNGTVVFRGNYLIGSSGPNGGVVWQFHR